MAKPQPPVIPAVHTGTDNNDSLTGAGTFIGGAGDDTLVATAPHNQFTGGAGNDEIHAYYNNPSYVGDDVYFSGDLSDYTILREKTPGGAVYVIDNRPGSPDGTDRLYGIVDLNFQDVHGFIPSTSNSGIIVQNGTGSDFTSTAFGDWIQEVSGNTTLHAGAGDDTVLASGMAVITVYGGAGDDSITGAAGNDYLHDFDGHNTLSGGAGNDTIAGVGHLDGGDGDDFLSSNTADYPLAVHEVYSPIGSTLDGGAGNDTLSGGGAGDTLNGGDGDDYINARAGANLIDGGAGDDVISGSGTIYGGDGNDNVGGQAGTQFTGGAGNDAYFAANNTDPDHRTEDLYFSGDLSDYRIVRLDGNDNAIGINDMRDGSPDGGDYVFGYVNLHFADGTVLTPDASNTGASISHTGDGTVQGTAFADFITQGEGQATIHAGGGDDIILVSGTAPVTVFGDSGNDLIVGSAGSDSLFGGDGNDSVYAGGLGDSSLNGGKGDDVLGGYLGNDTLDGGAGADTMQGGAGNDSYYVDNVGDVVSEQTVAGVDDGGTEHVYASVSFTLGAYIEHLTLTGSGNIDGTGNDLQNNLYGNGGDNVLTGNGGNDRIKGGAGNDTIIGGVGNDILEGDAGADRFVFSAAAVNGKDTIQDFEHGVDKLVFGVADYDATAGFTLGTKAVGAGAQFLWNEATHTLAYDHDGAGGDAATQIAVFANGAHIDASDFAWI